MSDTVCTLFEGHYHLGVGALINSLHASGFTGKVVCGYRGAEPAWADAARELECGIEVIFVPITTGVHFTNYKPEFLRDCWNTHGADADRLYYFDPDIVVKAPWGVLARWASDGVALCEDVNAYLPARHPYRLAWIDFLQANALPPSHPVERYYNAGFIGLPLAYQGLLDTWIQIVGLAAKQTGSNRLKNHQPHTLFHSADQDALNMALMVQNIPVNATGPEGMDFASGGHLLSHAIGGRKPWRGGFFRDALRGRPPGSAQKSFFRFAESPLRLFPSAQLARLRLSLRSGALLGRIYRRA